jgi:hypothetical protein
VHQVDSLGGARTSAVIRTVEYREKSGCVCVLRARQPRVPLRDACPAQVGIGDFFEDWRISRHRTVSPCFLTTRTECERIRDQRVISLYV